MGRKAPPRCRMSKTAVRRRLAKRRRQSEEPRDSKGANNSRPATRVQCPHCGHLFEFHIQQLRHLAACHRDYLDATEVGSLGKVILYQSTARLFHCARCFYTFKDFSKLFVHFIAKHCMEEEEEEEEEEKGGQRRMDEVGEAKITKGKGGIKGDVEGNVKEEAGQEGEGKAEMEMEEQEEETLEQTRGVEGVQLLSQNSAPLRPRPTEDGYCCPACGYEHQLETDVVEHLARCPDVRREDSAHPVKKGEEEEEEEGEEGSAPESSGQPHLTARGCLSKYISYTSSRYSCRLCSCYRRTKSRIVSHVQRSHEVNGPYKCHECPATFLLSRYLQQHASSAHRPRSYICPFCDVRSRSPVMLRLHCIRCRGSRGQEEGVEEGQLERMDIGGGEKQQQEEEEEKKQQQQEEEEKKQQEEEEKKKQQEEKQQEKED
ncbi:uncharacterized protein LOC142903103 [Nelusetta ayraudi]|uniref:uncharacterized protein LOC142903103 n=1 Tax=Nelusetta ayraudi TaxID=303726 RepID=UPI003F6F7DFC